MTPHKTVGIAQTYLFISNNITRLHIKLQKKCTTHNPADSQKVDQKSKKNF